MRTNRRQFLQTTALGAVAAPFFTSGAALAQDPKARPKVAAIGVGGSRGRYCQGTWDALWASEFGDLVAVCDADLLHAEEFNYKYNQKWKDAPRYLTKHTDYRKLLEEVRPEVVVIGTNDHWHVPIAIAALNSGCDVYCEKPLTLTIEEGALIREAAAKSGQVFQVGTQQRSQWGMRFLEAAAIVRLGLLGEVKRVHVAVDGGPGGQVEPTQAVPNGLDWDLWLGPALEAEYSSHRQKMFRWYFDYSGGKLTDWGAHHLDIALLALGKDHTGPVSISGGGEFTALVPDSFNWDAYLHGDASLPNGNQTPTKFSLSLDFADGVQMTVHDTYVNEETNTRVGNGILFEGSKGRMMVNRNRTTGGAYDNLSEEDHSLVREEMKRIYKGRTPEENHMKNFFQCIEDRGEPVSDVESHVRSMECCHLSNLALMLGRDVKWDPEKRTTVGDDQAAALMSRPRRQGYSLGETT